MYAVPPGGIRASAVPNSPRLRTPRWCALGGSGFLEKKFRNDCHQSIVIPFPNARTSFCPPPCVLGRPRGSQERNPRGNLRPGFCAGYIIGMLTEETEACVPPIKGSDAVRSVIEYIEAHSDQLNEAFDDLVERALIAIWPCKP